MTDTVNFFDYPELSSYRWSCSDQSKRFPIENPATGKVITHVQAGNADTAKQAVQASQVAFDERWRPLSPQRRSVYLFKCADALDKHLDDLATLLCMENGKPKQDARDYDCNFLVHTPDDQEIIQAHDMLTPLSTRSAPSATSPASATNCPPNSTTAAAATAPSSTSPGASAAASCPSTGRPFTRAASSPPRSRQAIP